MFKLMRVTVKKKQLIYGIIILFLLAISLFIWSNYKKIPGSSFYIFNKSKFCPDYGDCSDYGLESRKCEKIGDCVASCGYGCVSRKWMEDRVDCEIMWENFECECIDNICQRK